MVWPTSELKKDALLGLAHLLTKNGLSFKGPLEDKVEVATVMN